MDTSKPDRLGAVLPEEPLGRVVELQPQGAPEPVLARACGPPRRPTGRDLRGGTGRGDLTDAMARLDAGLTLSMPLSRPMPTIGRRSARARLKDRSGAYRAVYALPRAKWDGLRRACFQESDRAYPAARRGTGEKAFQGAQVMRTRFKRSRLTVYCGWWEPRVSRQRSAYGAPPDGAVIASASMI